MTIDYAREFSELQSRGSLYRIVPDVDEYRHEIKRVARAAKVRIITQEMHGRAAVWLRDNTPDDAAMREAADSIHFAFSPFGSSAKMTALRHGMRRAEMIGAWTDADRLSAYYDRFRKEWEQAGRPDVFEPTVSDRDRLTIAEIGRRVFD
jgi:hypothetical protein